MSSTHTYVSERRSLTTQIGWFSLCLLAAGWGPQLDSTLRQLWTNIGLFGLISAFGLEAGQRAIGANRQRKQLKITSRRIERTLTKIATENGTMNDLDTALRKIAEDGEGYHIREREIERRDETRLPFYHPVQVKSLNSNGDLSTENGRNTFKAFIRDISPGGVGLFHNQLIPSGRVMLTFKLHNAETVSIVAELLWRHYQPDGMYSSGGKLIEVITPVKAQESVKAGAE